MTDGQQIALAIAPTVLPTLTILVGILLNNRQVDATNRHITDLRELMTHRFDALEKLFDAKLQRVEEVMDARLKHLEQKAG